MGCCFGKEASAGDAEQRGSNNLKQQKDNRAANWRATGIVSLRDGNIKELPSVALELGPAVRTLDAHHNAITFLPPAIGDFTKMTRLVLSSNRLTSLPDAIGQCSALKALILDGNKITALPPSIGHLSKLEKLSVAGNDLQGLPETMGALVKLSTLNVAQNRLGVLPAGLGDCGGLEELDASSNQVKEIPASFGQLSRLRLMQLDDNSIPTVPPEVFKGCASLIMVSLHSNPISLSVLEKIDGFPEYERRRADKHGKQIAGGVMIGSAGLDTGLDSRPASASNYLPHK